MTADTRTNDLARIAARAADAKKGDDIVVLDVGDIIGIVDSFVITSASNTRLVRTIVEEVERAVHEQAGTKPRAVEGRVTLSERPGLGVTLDHAVLEAA